MASASLEAICRSIAPKRAVGSSIGMRSVGTTTEISSARSGSSQGVQGTFALTSAITTRARRRAVRRWSLTRPKLCSPRALAGLTSSITTSLRICPASSIGPIDEKWHGMGSSAPAATSFLSDPMPPMPLKRRWSACCGPKVLEKAVVQKNTPAPLKAARCATSLSVRLSGSPVPWPNTMPSPGRT